MFSYVLRVDQNVVRAVCYVAKLVPSIAGFA